MKTHSVHARAMVRLNRPAWFATFAGMCGSLVSIGLARFAYTPLIPPLIQAHWFSPANAVSLGAANFAGYLAGALLARLIAAALSSRQALRLLMFVATAAFFACAYPLSVVWFFVWNLRIADGSIMPRVPTGNAMATCIVIGERAAETLRNEHRLETSSVSRSAELQGLATQE